MRAAPIRSALVVATLALALLAGCGTSGGSDASDDASKAEGTTTAATTEEATVPSEDEVTTTEAEEEGATTTTEASPDGDEICGLLDELKTLDAEANDLVAAGDWTRIQAFYVDNTDDLISLYDDAIALDTEISDELETLRSVSESAGDLAEESTSLMDFGTKLAAQPGLDESSAAALTANEFSQETCGFPLAGF